ncbi:hypothetical protein ACFYXF_46655 [Streptomyces sp. NPDC002680]
MGVVRATLVVLLAMATAEVHLMTMSLVVGWGRSSGTAAHRPQQRR